jgi:hypothetical protein
MPDQPVRDEDLESDREGSFAERVDRIIARERTVLDRLAG